MTTATRLAAALAASLACTLTACVNDGGERPSADAPKLEIENETDAPIDVVLAAVFPTDRTGPVSWRLEPSTPVRLGPDTEHRFDLAFAHQRILADAQATHAERQANNPEAVIEFRPPALLEGPVVYWIGVTQPAPSWERPSWAWWELIHTGQEPLALREVSPGEFAFRSGDGREWTQPLPTNLVTARNLHIWTPSD